MLFVKEQTGPKRARMLQLLKKLESMRPTTLELDCIYVSGQEFKYLINNNPQLNNVVLYNFPERYFDDLSSLPQLESLTLQNAYIYGSSEPLKCLSQIRHLVLDSVEFKNGNFLLPENLHSLKMIDDYSDENDKSMECIAQLKYLRSLDLTRSNFTKSRIKLLSTMENLVFLKIQDSHIAGGCFEMLKSLKNLEILLFNSDVSEDELLRTLPYLTDLIRLSLLSFRGEGLSNKVLKMIGTLVHLQELSLSYCRRCTTRGLRELTKLPELTSLELIRTFDIQSMEPLAQLPKLQNLDLEGWISLTNKGLSHVKRLRALKSLNLEGCGLISISDEGIMHLKELENLEWLSLSRCKIKEGLKYLSGLSRLSYLDISCIRSITNESFKYLVPLKNLRYLNLSLCDNITDEALYYLGQIESLTELNVRQCTLITDEGLMHLRNLKNLKKLNIAECEKVTDAGLMHLASLENLVELNIYKCANLSNKGLNSLSHIRTLEFVYAEHCRHIYADEVKGFSTTEIWCTPWRKKIPPPSVPSKELVN